LETNIAFAYVLLALIGVQVVRIRGNEPDRLKSLYVLVNNIFLFFGCLDKRLSYITQPPEISSRCKHTNLQSLLYCIRHQNVSCLTSIHRLVTFSGLTIAGIVYHFSAILWFILRLNRSKSGYKGLIYVCYIIRKVESYHWLELLQRAFIALRKERTKVTKEGRPSTNVITFHHILRLGLMGWAVLTPESDTAIMFMLLVKISLCLTN
jgi:hypothetical protein